VIILDSKNNNILAMVGGYKDQAGGFNRAVQAFRQLGSSAKPFVYATALEEGVQPNSIFMDSEISINLANGSIWTPENDTKTTLGPVTLRTGLEKSLNTVTIRIADKIGINKIVNKLKEFGLNNNIERNLSIALGTFESSLLNTALAYSVFINNGQLVPATIITGIKNDVYNVDVSNLKILNMQKENMYKTINVKLDTKVDERENQNTEAKIEGDEKVDNIQNREDLKQTQIISKATAYQILSILEGAVARGTAHRLRDLRIPLAAKTGTTDNGQTIWTAAVTPEIIILSYIGHDIPKNTNNYGGQYPLQIVKDMLSTLKDSIKFTDFIAPEGVKYMKINKVNGKKATSSTKESNIIYEVLKIDDKTPETDVNEIETNNSDDAIVQY
jgi:penicillin-binding protein 1A